MKSRSSFARTLLILTLAACHPSAESDAVQAADQIPDRVAVVQPMPATVSAQRRTPTVVVAHSVLPSVVNIQTEATLRRQVDPFFGFFGRNPSYQSQSLGSGFVWAADGIIVTNAHVVEGASRITVNFQDGRQATAKVIGVDPDSDLAVLRVDTRKLVVAPIGTSSDLMIGETVVAVGNPFGLSGSVTTGVISAIGRSVPSREEGRTFTDFIQTDASINPGNSGGPLLNIEGKVIGINVAIYADAQGIGFAIPVDRAREIVEDLRRFGEVHRGWIGAVTATLTLEESRRQGRTPMRGALVTRVFEDSPAARAGLKPGDIIIRVGDRSVDSRESFSTLTETASRRDAVVVTFLRAERQQTVRLTPIDPPADLGLRILAQVSGIDVQPGTRGVLVSDVARGSRAAQVGLAPGDLLVGVNGVEIDSVDALNRELSRSSSRSSIVLSVARGRYVYTLTFPMGL